MSNPNISLIHQINPSFAQNAALAFAEANFLKEVITPVAYNPQAPVWQYLNLLPKQLRTFISNELSRRTWLSPHGVPITTYPWKEVIRIFLSRTKLVGYLGFSFTNLVDWV
ncbi:MAG: glycosyltransferase family 1 protein, partial [Dolichospermum sp.]